METTGRDSWSYRHEQTGSTSSYSTSSSRSGTIVSTTYTSGASRLSSSISMEAALLQLELQQHAGVDTSSIETGKKDAEFAQPNKKPRKETGETLKEKRMKHVKSMVQEFFSASSSANRSSQGTDINVLERWFTELGVGWVLHLTDYASEWDVRHSVNKIWSWILAFTEIMETISVTTYFFPDHGYGFVGMPGISEEEGEFPPEKQATSSQDPLQFALFIQEAISKMLSFVDVMSRKLPYTSNSLQQVALLRVHAALSRALSEIRLHFHPQPSAVVERIQNEMLSLLSAKQGQAFEATWSALEEIKTRVLKSMEDSLGSQTPQGSSDIDEATYSVMDHIKFLLDNHSTVTPLVYQAASLGKYVPQTQLGEAPPFISLITEMVSSLEEKLVTKSRFFMDERLRLLFLLNSSNFIREQLIKYPFSYINVIVAVVTPKVEHYIERYIEVSWAPMLYFLLNPTPLHLVRKYSPLSKFESKFQKTYTTQKLWKVPDSMLRKRLRKAVIEKIIPSYTKYIEDSKVTNPKFTHQELEEMLQELFEG